MYVVLSVQYGGTLSTCGAFDNFLDADSRAVQVANDPKHRSAFTWIVKGFSMFTPEQVNDGPFFLSDEPLDYNYTLLKHHRAEKRLEAIAQMKQYKTPIWSEF